MAAIKKKDKTSVLAPGGHYLYMLKLTSTGHFYIGATMDWEKRQDNHMNLIINLVHDLRTHEIIHSRKKNKPSFKQTRGSKVHMFFAEKIKPLVSHIISPRTIVGWHYTFHVMERMITDTELKEKEDKMLKKHQYDPLCLNVSFTSSYNKKRSVSCAKRRDELVAEAYIKYRKIKK